MKTDTIVLATGNRDKLAEMIHCLGVSGSAPGEGEEAGEEALGNLHIVSSGDLGITLPEETGQTLEENAMLKARAAAGESGYPALADDTGLFVEALDGKPGIYSARFAGPDAGYGDNCDLLLQLMKDMNNRNAVFRTVIAFVKPADSKKYRKYGNFLDRLDDFVVSGEVQGRIAVKPCGTSGFGYDPLFYAPEYDKTYAQMSTEEKNQVSHRARAMDALVQLFHQAAKETAKEAAKAS